MREIMKVNAQNVKKIIKKLIIVGAISSAWALIIAVIITGHLWDINNIQANLAGLRIWTSLNRAYLLFFVLFFVGLHFIFPVKKMYNWMFEKRWVLGILLLLFLTINRYHGDSITYYSEFVQPNMGNMQASNPIWGEIRSIRSDEFLVSTPSTLASGYGDNPYGKYNNIMRGTETLNITSGIYAGYATIASDIFRLVYLILPTEYAFSFSWYAPLVFGFLMSIELFYIISKKNKLVSVTGAFLIIFSSFYLWWGFSGFFISAPGTVVCLYYFLNNKEYWKKILYAVGIALCFSRFIVQIYPAWQVPLGYMFLAIGIWLLHDNWDKVKQLKKTDWFVLFGAMVFCLSLVIAYFFEISEYTKIISNTVYPGARIDNGSFKLSKLFYYAQAPFYAYKEIGNPSEAGCFFSLFPVPTIMAIYQWFHEKRKDWLTGGLLLVQIPMILYVTTGLPAIVAKLTLFSNSTTIRTQDIIGLIQIYLIVIILSRYSEARKMPVPVVILVAVITSAGSIVVSNHDYPDYLPAFFKILMFVTIMFFSSGVMLNLKGRMKKLLLLGFVGISVFTGIYIRPLMKGLDAIYSKPVASEIQDICEKDKHSKWLTIGGSPGLSAYAVACGAPTINSVNTYPNIGLWEKLDDENKYEEVYNRYAHIDLQLTKEDTGFEEIQSDFIRISLSYKDIQKTGATHLMILEGINIDDNNGYVKFEKLYEEDGVSIYHLKY